MEMINKQYALASAISGLVRTDENGEKWIRVRDVRESITNVPTIEAELIVRCKDCKYNYANMIPGGKGCQQNIYVEVDDNFFCADGERENEEEE